MNKIKIVLLGSPIVGKTSLLKQYFNKTFSNDYIISTTNNIQQKNIEINNQIINLEFWDIPGLEMYRNKIFYENSKIALLIYDISNCDSFTELNNFYNDIINMNGINNTYIVIIANKNDLYNQHQISNNEGKIYANSINADFFDLNSLDYNLIEKTIKQIVTKYIGIFLNENKENKQIDNDANSNSKQYKFTISDSSILSNNTIINEINRTNIEILDIYDKNLIKEEKNSKKYENGDYYKGFFKFGLKNGKGTMKYKNGEQNLAMW